MSRPIAEYLVRNLAQWPAIATAISGTQLVGRRYKDAAARHQLAIWRGEEVDEESGLSHRAHLAWNQLAILSLEESQE